MGKRRGDRRSGQSSRPTKRYTAAELAQGWCVELGQISGILIRLQRRAGELSAVRNAEHKPTYTEAEARESIEKYCRFHGLPLQLEPFQVSRLNQPTGPVIDAALVPESVAETPAAQPALGCAMGPITHLIAHLATRGSVVRRDGKALPALARQLGLSRKATRDLIAVAFDIGFVGTVNCASLYYHIGLTRTGRACYDKSRQQSQAA